MIGAAGLRTAELWAVNDETSGNSAASSIAVAGHTGGTRLPRAFGAIAAKRLESLASLLTNPGETKCYSPSFVVWFHMVLYGILCGV